MQYKNLFSKLKSNNFTRMTLRERTDYGETELTQNDRFIRVHCNLANHYKYEAHVEPTLARDGYVGIRVINKNLKRSMIYES